MGDVFDWFGSVGAGLVGSVLTISYFFASGWIGIKVFEAFNSKILGWIAGIVALVLFVIIFAPTMAALDEVRCKGAEDYQRCLERDYEEPLYL